MFSTKPVVLVILEPALNEVGYVSKYIPLIKKHIDCNLFEVHLIGSYSGSKPLKEKFNNVHPVMFCPTATSGLEFYLGYMSYLVFVCFNALRLAPKIGAHVLISLGGHAYSGLIVSIVSKFLRSRSVIRISEPTRYIVWSRYSLGPLVSCVVNLLERLAFSLSDIVISNRDMHWYSSRIGKKQVVLSQGVDLSIFNNKAIPAFHSKSYPKLITVARLDKQKNIESIIEAVVLLKKKYPEILYLIVGSGFDESDLRDKVAKLSLEKNVCFFGQTNPQMIPKLLISCDIFVLASFIEGMPSAILEAMACGLPVVIGSAKFGLKDWVFGSETALVVDSDSRSLADAIDLLVSNTELKRTLIDNSEIFIKKYHDSSQTKKHFVAMIESLLKKN